MMKCACAASSASGKDTDAATQASSIERAS